MFQELLQPLRRQRLAQKLARARSRGTGLYVGEWRAEADDGTGAGPPVSASGILVWCRETVARTRRPGGIASFDLALAAASESVRHGSLSFRRLSPTDLYPGDSFQAEVERFLSAHRPVTHLAAALFSWGDAAHALQA